METILNFVYPGKIKFSSKNLEKIVRAANYFQLSIISDRCSDLLTSRINAANVLGIRQFAIQHNSPQAVAVADRYIQRHFAEIVANEEFLSLDVSALMQVLSWDELYVESEEQIFEAAVRWLEHDLETRKVLSPRVFSTVRMPLLKPSFSADEVTRNPIIRNSIECRDLVDEAKNFHLIPERRPQFHSFKTTARMCSDVPGLIYAVGGFNTAGVPIHRKPSASLVEMYDPLVGKWCLAKGMLSSRSRVGVAVSDRKMFVIGGYNGMDRLRCVEVFDSRTSTWEKIAPMLQKQSALCAGAIGDQVYVCGGYDGIHALATVESYDIKTERWQMRPPMLSERCAAAASVINGCIYVMGGHNGVVIFKTVEKFDPISRRWSKVTSMNAPRCRLSAVTFHGKIYAAGGYNSQFLNTFEVFDPATDTWTQLTPMNMRRAKVSLVANGSLLYVFGGYDGENNLGIYQLGQSSSESSSGAKDQQSSSQKTSLEQKADSVPSVNMSSSESSSGAKDQQSSSQKSSPKQKDNSGTASTGSWCADSAPPVNVTSKFWTATGDTSPSESSGQNANPAANESEGKQSSLSFRSDSGLAGFKADFTPLNKKLENIEEGTPLKAPLVQLTEIVERGFQHFDDQFAKVDARFDRMSASVNARFDKVDFGLDALNERLDRLSGVHKRHDDIAMIVERQAQSCLEKKQEYKGRTFVHQFNLLYGENKYDKEEIDVFSDPIEGEAAIMAECTVSLTYLGRNDKVEQCDRKRERLAQCLPKSTKIIAYIFAMRIDPTMEEKIRAKIKEHEIILKLSQDG